jgi:hypothetical protein
VSERRDNSGTLGANQRKEKDTHPTHTGQCLIEGKPYWISAWVKEGTNGRFFSLSFKPKEAQTEQRRAQAPVTDSAGFDDDIPF